MYRRGADVVAFDMDADELAGVQRPLPRDEGSRRGARGRRGRRQAGRRARSCRSPTASSTASSPPRCSSTSTPTSTRSRSWSASCGRAARLADLGAALAARGHQLEALDDYHNAEGGHIRIYTDHELVDKVTKAGRFNDGTPGDAMVFEGKGYAHGLHSPYWWIKCAVGVRTTDHPSRRPTTGSWSGRS
jgi:hypothetical protein